MKHLTEPLANFEVGPLRQEVEFLMDTGAERSSVKKLPMGVTLGKKTCEVLGAEGKPFKAPMIENVEIRGNSKQCRVKVIYLPKLESNLLGRDIQVYLGTGVIPENEKMVVKIMTLMQCDIEEINPEVWAGQGQRGLIKIPPIMVEMVENTPLVKSNNNPFHLKGRKG